MTDSAYRQLSAAESIAKSLGWDLMIQALLIRYCGPVLLVPVVGPVFKALVAFFTDKIFEACRLVLDMSAIRFVNSVHQAEYDRESIRLKVLAHDMGTDSPEFKKEREDAKASLARLMSFGG